MMRIPTKGSLGKTSLVAILNECAEEGTTGMVRAENGAAIKVVYLQNGTIAYASSNDRSDRLTEVLKRASKLTQEQVEHAQERVKPGVSLGKTLVELGFLTSKELLWGAKAQVEAIIHQLLFWNKGTYQILQGSLPKEIVSLNISPYQIIFSGIVKSTDRQWVLEQIGSPEAVYGLSEEFHLKNAAYRLPIETIVSRINGKRTLNEIAQTSGTDAFEVCKTVAALELLGMAKRMKDKAHQMPLLLEESKKTIVTLEEQPSEEKPIPAAHDVSLGEILQIPTVEQLQKEVKEITPEPVEISTEEQIAKSQEKEIESQEPGGKTSDALDANHVVFVPTDIHGSEERGFFGISPYRAIILIAAALVLGIAFFLFLNYLLGGEKQTIKTNSKLPPPPSTATTSVSSKPAKKEERPSPQVLAQSGQIQEAALIWKNTLSGEKTKYTLQLILGCQEKTLLDTMNALGNLDQLMIVPADFKGQTCYRIIYGIYASEGEATVARTSLPSAFEKRRIQAQVVPIIRILQ